MTLEYVLLLVVVFIFGLKFFTSAPMEAFKNSSPRLGARVERQLETGSGFTPTKSGTKAAWSQDSQQ